MKDFNSFSNTNNHTSLKAEACCLMTYSPEGLQFQDDPCKLKLQNGPFA